MRFARFFIDRPIFASVLSILIVIAGLLTVKSLPLTEYPTVMPPTVQVRAMYPGANPKTIAETVAAPLEQELSGMNGMQYMSSQATSDGRMTLTVTFAQGIDPEMAQVEVQNRVSRAVPGFERARDPAHQRCSPMGAKARSAASTAAAGVPPLHVSGEGARG